VDGKASRRAGIFSSSGRNGPTIAIYHRRREYCLPSELSGEVARA
jgi:hypothetical protein